MIPGIILGLVDQLLLELVVEETVSFLTRKMRERKESQSERDVNRIYRKNIDLGF